MLANLPRMSFLSFHLLGVSPTMEASLLAAWPRISCLAHSLSPGITMKTRQSSLRNFLLSSTPVGLSLQAPRTEEIVRPIVRPDSPPNIIISAPLLKDFAGSPLNATITCTAINLHTQKTTIQWLRDGKVIESDEPTTIRISKRSYSVRSELTITKNDWDNGKKFSCKVSNERFSGLKNISRPLICGGLSIPVMVETIQPSYADIYQTKSAKLTCRISNIPDEQDLKELNVTWTRASDDKPLDTELETYHDEENSDLIYADAVATVCVDEWEKGETFNCKIIHPDLFPSMEVRSLRKPQDGNPSAPHIYILPPPPDQLALQETATVTCLMKDFSPPEFFVKWLRNDEPVDASKYFTSTATQESKAPKRYYAYSMLNVNAEEWNSGTTYTCMVGHEMLPLQTSQKTIDKNTGKPTVVNVSLVLSDTASTCQ
ncbi:immunoglobulin heavy chain constant region [Podarcis lilfordi]|nr:immunoglobulin heavy chain constant region [Podarcis lilfordi]